MSEKDIVEEARELLANAAHGPLTLIRYEHGGGRLYREEPRDLIADFYDVHNRELYYRAPELLRALADEVEQLRELVVHMHVHSGYRNNGYMQMTTEQKALYDAIWERSVAELDAEETSHARQRTNRVTARNDRTR